MCARQRSGFAKVLSTGLLAAQAERTGLLHLPNRFYAAVPGAVFELRELRRLDLSFNCLQSLPAEISRLAKLEELFLSRNPLQAVPPEIARCESLEVSDGGS